MLNLLDKFREVVLTCDDHNSLKILIIPKIVNQINPEIYGQRTVFSIALAPPLDGKRTERTIFLLTKHNF